MSGVSTRHRRTASATSRSLERTEGRGRRNSDVDGPKHALQIAQLQEENVFLFVPNLIGYTRVILAALSLHYMATHPKACTVLYAISCLLDAVDGQAARYLKQTSKFGAVLDMVTDRCTTSCLLCFLSSAYPSFATIFQFLITLDFSSHFMHMYSTLVTGQDSHKAVTVDVSRILWYYYNDPTTLFTFCAGNETFFIALYLMKWEAGIPIGSPFTEFAAYTPAFVASFIAGLTWLQLLACITFPIFAAKNIINVVQLWKASKILVGVDIAQRARARQEAAMKEE